MKIEWLTVARDAIIVQLVRFAGGLLVGVAAGGSGPSDLARNRWDLLLMIVGFCVVGCLRRTRRMAHLGVVAGGVWLITGANLLTADLSVAAWIRYVLPIALASLLGGGASLLIVRSPRAEPPASAP